ncbi:MAG: hypothetical protein QOJ55_1148, partial [Solirubrobacteraceae bacterium]|nr:hypothetical protein [Solirubrobacteraceae bacterium]
MVSVEATAAALSGEHNPPATFAPVSRLGLTPVAVRAWRTFNGTVTDGRSIDLVIL